MGRGNGVPHKNRRGQCDTSTKYSCTSFTISTDNAMNDDPIMIASPTNLGLPKGMQSLQNRNQNECNQYFTTYHNQLQFHSFRLKDYRKLDSGDSVVLLK